jgi:signal transduction histidine kinase
MAKQALDSVRRFARDLRPTVLDDLGLIAAIHWLVSDMGRRLGIEARMETSGRLRRLDTEVALFRVVQEALHNTERHASASEVLVQVRFLPKSVLLTITDNGRGFTPPTALHSLVGEGHLGLLGMQERVQLLGGSLALSASPGQGVRIEVSVPDAAAPSAAST